MFNGYVLTKLKLIMQETVQPGGWNSFQRGLCCSDSLQLFQTPQSSSKSQSALLFKKNVTEF